MQFAVRHGSLIDEPCDVLIVNMFEGVKEPSGATSAVDQALGGAISELVRNEEFEGHLSEIAVIQPCTGVPARKVMIVGLGKENEFGVHEVMRASACAGRTCRALRAKKVASVLHGGGTALSAFDCGRAVTLGTILGTYEHTRLKTEGAKPNSIESFEIVELSAEKINEVEQGMRRAEVIGDAVTFARDLANEPSNVVTPSYLADLAEQIASEAGMKCAVKDRQGIEDAGMGLLAAVARGSSVEPRFIEMKYECPGATKTVAVVGKGITFDSGGYSLKGMDFMYGMKDDMSGAANVLAAMRAIGKLKPNVNVLGLMPCTENMIGSRAIHPGDVFTSLAGKTVEVNNTDAEGRLIISDAVAYAANQGVAEIIDQATLTGACVVALGHKISGIFGNRQEMVDKLIRAGAACGEVYWQLPLYPEYKQLLKSDIADLKNTGGRQAGAIYGAQFIGSFVGDTAWVHIDLSSSGVDEDTDLAKKGATAVGTGTLIEYLMES